MKISLFQIPKEAVVDSSFSLALAREFPPQIQVHSLLRLLEYVSKLPEEKPEGEHIQMCLRNTARFANVHCNSTGVSKLRQLPRTVTILFNVAAHTAKQLRHFKYSSLSLMVQLLSSRAFQAQV